MKIIKGSIIVIFILSCFNKSYCSNLILNSSFENGTYTEDLTQTGNPTFTFEDWYNLGPMWNDPNNLNTSWSNAYLIPSDQIGANFYHHVDYPTDYKDFNVGLNVPDSPDGGNYMGFVRVDNWQSGIAQDLTGLRVGEVYKLSFWQMNIGEWVIGGNRWPTNDYIFTDDAWIDVTLDGVIQSSQVSVHQGGDIKLWDYHEMYFRPSNEDARIYIRNGGPFNTLMLFDGVRLDHVPEPSSILLILYFILSLIYIRRKK